MGFPYEVYENFENGAADAFNGTGSDVGNRLDFPHQRQLSPLMPWRGAYCMRVNLGKNSTTAYVERTVSWASGINRYGRFKMFIGEDVQFGNDMDYVRILQFYSSGPTKEARLTLGRIEPFGLVLAAEMEGETWGARGSYFKVPTGQWFTVEFKREVDTSSGSLALVLPDVGWATSSPQAEGTNTAFRLGAVEETGDIQGTLYFDDFMVDEARLYDDHHAHNGALSGESMHLVGTGFAFLGRGEIEHVTLIDGGSGDCKLRIWDTDRETLLTSHAIKAYLATSVADESQQTRGLRFRCNVGCYVKLDGTNPRAILRLGKVDSDAA